MADGGAYPSAFSHAEKVRAAKLAYELAVKRWAASAHVAVAVRLRLSAMQAECDRRKRHLELAESVLMSLRPL